LPTEHHHGESLSSENELFLRSYIQRESGIALGDDKRYLLQSRLLPLLADTFASLDGLCDQLRKSPQGPLRRAVVEALTTHETLFFRDLSVFDCIRTHILPGIAKRRRQAKTFRIWSAACSSGQEPYTLAMMALECGYADWNVQIIATDLSTKILERAATGSFLQLEVNRGLPAQLLVKYFDKAGRDWRVKDSVRKLVTFSRFDLRDSMEPLGMFDLVLCRNVLIYFDQDTRRRVLAGIQQRLSPEGYLILGSSESILGLNDGYTRQRLGDSVVYQKPL
jgi:chemotaxis protein methyltransferase CheR